MFPKSYSFNIDYQNKSASYPSGFSSGNDDLDTTKEELLKYINYYASLPRDIIAVELVEFCKTCNGYGEVHVPYKRKAGGKNVRCPDCKGKGLPKDIIRL